MTVTRVCVQVSMPTKSFDAPISTVSGHKASSSPSDEVWGENVAEEGEGAPHGSLLSKLAHECGNDLLQHDVNQLLNTLQPRERNVSVLHLLHSFKIPCRYSSAPWFVHLGVPVYSDHFVERRRKLCTVKHRRLLCSPSAGL